MNHVLAIGLIAAIAAVVWLVGVANFLAVLIYATLGCALYMTVYLIVVILRRFASNP